MWLSYLRLATLIAVAVANTTDPDPGPSSTASLTTEETVTIKTRLYTTASRKKRTTIKKSTIGKTTSFPYVVSIGTYENGNYKHLCVGVIISKEHLLSAAHCVKSKKSIQRGNLYVIGGSDTVNGKVQTRFAVVGIEAHPNFKILGGYDIAVLKVSPQFPQNDRRFKSVSVTHNLPSAGYTASLVGWGRVKIRQVKTLQPTPYRTIENSVCLRSHRFVFLKGTDVCAVHLKGSQGACDGDSGAPLIDVQKEQLYGLLSYGRKACQPFKPYAFTRVSMLSDWIKRSIQSM